MALLFSTVIIGADANNKVPSILLPLARYLPRLANTDADIGIADKRFLAMAYWLRSNRGSVMWAANNVGA